MTDRPGYQRFKESYQQLKNGKTPSNKKAIWEMNLSEALEAQQKYLDWVEKYPDHPEASNKEYIYRSYLLPRIEELQLQHTVSKELIEEKKEPQIINGYVVG